MAKLQILKTGNSIVVIFNDYASLNNINSKKRSYSINDIVEIDYNYQNDYIIIMMRDAHGSDTWYVTYDNTYVGSEWFIVDSVNSITPTNNDNLFDMLTALR